MKNPSFSVPIGQEPFPVSLIPFSPPPFLLLRFPGDDLQEALGVPRELRSKLSFSVRNIGKYNLEFEVEVSVPLSKGGLFSKLSDLGKALSRQGHDKIFGRFYPESFEYWMRGLTPNRDDKEANAVAIGGTFSPSRGYDAVETATRYFISYLAPIFALKSGSGSSYSDDEKQRLERLLSGDKEEFERVLKHLWITFTSSLGGGVNRQDYEKSIYFFSGGSGPGSYVLFSFWLNQVVPSSRSRSTPFRKREVFLSDGKNFGDYLLKYKVRSLNLFFIFKVSFEDFRKAFERSVREKDISFVKIEEVPVVGILSSRSYESEISFNDFLGKTSQGEEKHEFVNLSSSLGKIAFLPKIYRKLSYGVYAFSSDHAKDLGNPGFSVYRGFQFEHRVINLEDYIAKQNSEVPLFLADENSQSLLPPILDGFLEKAVEYYTTYISEKRNSISDNRPGPQYSERLRVLDPYYEYVLISHKGEEQDNYLKDNLYLWKGYIRPLSPDKDKNRFLFRIPKLVLFLVSSLSSGVAEPSDLPTFYQKLLQTGVLLKDILAKKEVSYDSGDYKLFQEMFYSYLRSVLNPVFRRVFSSVHSYYSQDKASSDDSTSLCLNGFPVPAYSVFLYEDSDDTEPLEDLLSKYAGSLFLHQYISWFMRKMREINGVSHRVGVFKSLSMSYSVGYHFCPFGDGTHRAVFVDMDSSGAVKRVVPIIIGKVPSFSVGIFHPSGEKRLFFHEVSQTNEVSFSWNYVA